MGKGDPRTKRGKIIMGSFGKSRPARTPSDYKPTTASKTKVAAKSEVKEAAKAAPKAAAKATPKKKTTRKKVSKK